MNGTAYYTLYWSCRKGITEKQTQALYVLRKKIAKDSLKNRKTMSEDDYLEWLDYKENLIAQ